MNTQRSIFINVLLLYADYVEIQYECTFCFLYPQFESHITKCSSYNYFLCTNICFNEIAQFTLHPKGIYSMKFFINVFFLLFFFNFAFFLHKLSLQKNVQQSFFSFLYFSVSSLWTSNRNWVVACSQVFIFQMLIVERETNDHMGMIL